jgi:hypothetical protein
MTIVVTWTIGIDDGTGTTDETKVVGTELGTFDQATTTTDG